MVKLKRIGYYAKSCCMYSTFSDSTKQFHSRLIKMMILLLVGIFLYSNEAQSSTCFLGDGDCQKKIGFSSYKYSDNSDLCTNDEYEKKACKDDQLVYYCPYNAKYVICCDKSYKYDVCLYPLEIDGKCGSKTDYKYKCKCPSSYKITDEMATRQNCQPSDACTLDDGTGTVTKYKTCTCSQNIYTDKGSCSHNQTEASSCTDGSGVTYKKCYCDRTKYPYAFCEYGMADGAKTCTDSATQTVYYSACKEPECTPLSSETNCANGTTTCSDGCGGTRTCCATKKMYYDVKFTVNSSTSSGDRDNYTTVCIRMKVVDQDGNDVTKSTNAKFVYSYDYVEGARTGGGSGSEDVTGEYSSKTGIVEDCFTTWDSSEEDDNYMRIMADSYTCWINGVKYGPYTGFPKNFSIDL